MIGGLAVKVLDCSVRFCRFEPTRDSGVPSDKSYRVGIRLPPAQSCPNGNLTSLPGNGTKVCVLHTCMLCILEISWKVAVMIFLALHIVIQYTSFCLQSLPLPSLPLSHSNLPPLSHSNLPILLLFFSPPYKLYRSGMVSSDCASSVRTRH